MMHRIVRRIRALLRQEPSPKFVTRMKESRTSATRESRAAIRALQARRNVLTATDRITVEPPRRKETP